MSTPNIIHITSRDNALLKDLHKLSTDSTAYRKQGQVWLEGDHLCRAAIERGVQPIMKVFKESFLSLAGEYITYCAMNNIAIKNITIADKLWPEISGLESPAKMGFVIDIHNATKVQFGIPTVILDRVQDAGNVGSILRSAAAFGFKQVVALKGTAALWSPKVLRSGMGAHFALQLIESVTLEDLAELDIPLVVTSSHQGDFLQSVKLPKPCAWVMGHEGQGVCNELLSRAAVSVRIGQPGGEESLNVAAAAAICLHASSLQF